MSDLMVDIHAHILPGLDDGPSDLEGSLALLKLMAEDGIGTVIATPHVMPGYLWPYDAAKVLPRVEELNRAAQEVGLNIKVLPGAEIYLAPELVKEAEKNALPTLAGTKKLLVEFSREEIPWWADEVFFKLQRLGYELILAHPEFYRKFRHHPEMAECYADQGVELQVDASSLAGAWGEHIQVFAHQLVRKDLCHYVATDAHSPERPPLLREALKYLGAAESDFLPLFTGEFLNVEGEISEAES